MDGSMDVYETLKGALGIVARVVLPMAGLLFYMCQQSIYLLTMAQTKNNDTPQAQLEMLPTH